MTAGDPRGIGPEVAAEAVRIVRGEAVAFEPSLALPGGLRPWDELPEPLGSLWHGIADSDREAGAAAAGAIERAVDAARSRRVHAVVTGPIHKPSLHAAGWTVPGHTEMLQELTGVSAVGMLMDAERTSSGRTLRVLLATTHHPLRDVPDLVTEDLLVEQTRLLARALSGDWRIEDPRVALCGLNPHASDDGLFGDEEERVFRPAVARLRAEGVRASGPFPADTVFQRALSGAFDAVVAPYHDVGMAAFKTVAFGTGVNVTLGLPFVRTSPDHGTAFDLAGTGRADPGSMAEALRLAIRLARGRFDTADSGV